jgi:DNA replication initiation complex subunit (GINS family)
LATLKKHSIKLNKKQHSNTGETFERYKEYVVEDPKAQTKQLQHLTQEEKLLYESLHKQRLEQERIPF